MAHPKFRRQHPMRRHPLSILIGALFAASPAWAINPNTIPSGGVIVAGNGNIVSGSNHLTVQQQSQQLIANWDSFNIGANATVQFIQPSASAVALNRVLSNDASQIYGRLSANGQVFLVNPNGVYFAPGASVNAGSLVASTLDISNEDFASGVYRFNRGQGSAGTVLNQGRLEAANGGSIALIGAKVVNEGEMTARNGTVALASGDQVTLDFHGDGLLMVNVNKEALAAETINRGLITADGGNVVMKASAKNALLETVVNNSGIIRARSIGMRNGTVVLDGGPEGVVMHSGKIEVSGLAAGEKGGTAKVLGDKVALTGAAEIDARGDARGGTVLVGGNYQGTGSERRASATFVGKDAVILVDALNQGDGGMAVIWADDNTRFYGTIRARGGTHAGNGGEVEVSGKNYLEFQGDVDAGAAAGRAGTLLLDPTDITIVSADTATPDTGQVTDGTNGGVLFGDATAVNASEILNTTISNLLSAGTNVRISTNNASGSAPNGGSITVNADITKVAGGEASLRLEADRDINVNASIKSNADKLNVVLNSGRQASGIGSVTIGAGAQVVSNGGDITIGGGADPATGAALGGGTTSNGFRMQGGGTSQSTGALLSSGAGNITINAAGSTASGITMQSAGYSTILSTSGNITINGVAGANTSGINMSTGNNTISSLSGNITLNGTAPGSGGGITLSSGGTNVITSQTGSITLNGSSSGGTDLNFAPSTGAVRIGTHTGATANHDLSFTGASSSSITFNGNTLALASTGSGSVEVKSSGALTIAPRTAGTTIGIGNMPGGTNTLVLDAAKLAALKSGFSSITIGRADGTGTINLGSASFADKLVLRGGATSIAAGTYVFNGGLDLAANGSVTFGTGAVNMMTSNDAVILASTQHIDFNEASGSSASIATNGGAIVLNSRSGNGAAGYVDIRNTSLISGGGDITIGGGADPVTGYAIGAGTGMTNGVRFGGTTISSGAGNIVINGQGGTATASGVSMGNGSRNSISATSGNVTISGKSDTASGISMGSGTAAGGQTITTTTGNISLTGISNSGDAVRIGSTSANTSVTLATASGNIHISGSTAGGSGDGLNIGAGSVNVQTSTGKITLNGSAGGDGNGVTLGPVGSATTTALSTVSGDISVVGTSSSGYGINFFASGSGGVRGSSTIETGSGNVSMTGTSTSNIGFRNNPASTGDTRIRTATGNIAITGMTSAADMNAVEIDPQTSSGNNGQATIEATGLGNISIAGDRIGLDGKLANIVGAGGALTLRATTPGTTIGFGSGTTGSLAFTNTQLGAIKGSYRAIYVGDQTAGAVDIGTSLPATLPVAPTAITGKGGGSPSQGGKVFSPEEAAFIAARVANMAGSENARLSNAERFDMGEADSEKVDLKIGSRETCGRNASGNATACPEKNKH